MTEEEKELLLKDLCARLPYGVIVEYGCKHEDKDLGERKGKLTGRMLDSYSKGIQIGMSEVYSLTPYLRQMSSMTEEEKEELNELTNGIICFNNYDNISTTVCHKGNPHYWCTELGDWIKVIDFLLRKHFDIFGFIGKGLALDALEGMYN